MSDSQWWFLDLAAVIAFTGALTFGIVSGIDGVIRTAIALPMVLCLPGYAFVSILFPSEPTDEYQSFDTLKTGLETPRLVSGGLESVERFVLSVVFSIALVPAVTLFASVTPRGITAETVLLGLASLTVVLSLLAIASRYRCPAERRFAPSVSVGSLFFSRERPNVYERLNPRPYNVAIAVGLVVLLASAGFAATNPPQGDGFTELSVETENVTGETDTMYNSTYTAGQAEDLQVTITNQEHAERDYTTVVLLERVEQGDGDEANVTERNELARASVTVADGETRKQSLEITPTMSGDDLRITVLLYQGEAPSEPAAEDAYRTMHLPVVVE
ncbi:Protein of unknown function DUF1616 [Haloterrigena turkmenica DSM 5511]|uniref:DUF1616 domain-containing protein n=1 Tax=Haloterrigena turkmenica (strain ATCC 51198 / DSM 5511 / JCM 9101 / NCIMB 13204 / VKM B-1734 / 4k) TaxID=543526 RepID=D2RZA5_HALTV|nr:DUF1616 domain-containing protein [Haloterrigena turkmenica]ADB60029.1 Protein of unknown function DUF1616 [Haloterrigena turkmenica DSM 5511]